MKNKHFIFFSLLVASSLSFGQSFNKIDSDGRLQGPWQFYDQNGKIYLKANYLDSKPIDTLIFYKNGIEALRLFDDGNLHFHLIEESLKITRKKEGSSFVYRLENGKVFENRELLYPYMETDAQFPGGEEALSKYQLDNLSYPKSLKKRTKEGVVIANFKVDKSGQISDPNIEKSSYRKFNKEVLRMIESMPRWQPGLQRGYPVNVRSRITVKFRF